MRSVYRTAFAVLVVALLAGAVGASSAFAAPEWYSSATKPSVEWWQGGAKLSGSVATKNKDRVRLEDRGASTAVECESSGEGTAGTGAVDKQTSWTLSSCTIPAKAINAKGEEVANLCESVKTGTKMVDFPWHSELSLTKGSLYDVISAEGAGAPGFQIECKTKLGTLADKCTPSESHINVSIQGVTSGVEAVFPNGTLYNCAIGGNGLGVLQTAQLIEATTGGKLETHITAGTYSKLTSSAAVKATGEFTVEDTGFGSFGTKCQMTFIGTIGTGGKGTITGSSSSSCLGTGRCQSVISDETIGYPWATELIESGGVIKDKIASGVESPGWKFECNETGGRRQDTCSMIVSPTLVNGLEGNVFARFGESLTFCKDGGYENDGVVKGELTIVPSSGAIEAK